MIANIGLGELLWLLLVSYLMAMCVIVVITAYVDMLPSEDLTDAEGHLGPGSAVLPERQLGGVSRHS